MTSTQRTWTGAALAAVGLLWIRRAARRPPVSFRGKSVLITGGSRGLGLVLARQFAAERARVTILARDERELARAADDLHRHHGAAEIMTITADVRREHDMARAIQQVVDRTGRVDVLINNAAIIQVGPFAHMTPADFEDAMATHFWGPLFATLAVLPTMRRQGGGRIVNISSIGGRVAVPHLLPYSASKFALAGLSDGLRAELAQDRIRVTSVFPGLMRTGSPVNAAFKGRHEDEYAWFTIADSLPFVSTDARRAAAQIVEACRRGRSELVISTPAKLAIVTRTLCPELFAGVMATMNRLLPVQAGRAGDVGRPGRDSESRLAGPSSVLTRPAYRAAVRHNQQPRRR